MVYATVSYETFQRQKYPKFGHDNPHPMNFEFWLYMVETGYSAWEAREEFGCTNKLREGPIWCFQRHGMSSTLLPDGRVVHIGGEHEEYFDPDYCIYNDVVVKHPNGEIDIYGYPMNFFQPSHYHSATLVDNNIYIIGSLGYQQDRVLGETRVFVLDCDTFEMKKLNTKGENPGWIYEHSSEYIQEKNCLRIEKGKIITFDTDTEGNSENDKNVYEENQEVFLLNLTTKQWFAVKK